jgi:dTMP kinase
MKALEESQAAAKRQMEDEDQLADLRQRNARLERGDVDMAEVLRVRHEARDKADEERRRKEAEEDEEVVKQYFYKVKKGGAGLESIKEDADKPKEKPAGVGLGDGYGSSDDEEEKTEEPTTVTVKRTPLPSASGTTASEPTVQDLLAAKGIALPTSSKPAVPNSTAKSSALGIKRKDGASGLGVKLVKKKKIV